MKRIRRRCTCGCGGITNYGKMYIHGHHMCGKEFSVETKRKLSLTRQGRKPMLGYKHSAETIKKMSEAKKGKEFSAEAKLNMSLAQIKYDPNYPYCDVWRDKEYRKDLKKDYCENINCKKDYKRLVNHHIYLDKKRCGPNDIITLCNPCHIILHRKLQRGTNIPIDPKDFIIINRPDHVLYIHKEPREKIIIRRLL